MYYTVTVEEDDNIILDLNGFALNTTKSLINKGTLKIVDNSQDKNTCDSQQDVPSKSGGIKFLFLSLFHYTSSCDEKHPSDYITNDSRHAKPPQSRLSRNRGG